METNQTLDQDGIKTQPVIPLKILQLQANDPLDGDIQDVPDNQQLISGVPEQPNEDS